MSSEILKPKKVMTEAMLANLALARVSAKKKREQIGELTRLKKEVVEKRQTDEISSLRKVLNSNPIDDANDDEAEPPPPPIKKPKVPKAPIIIIEDSESEDEQVFYVKRKSRFAPAPAPAPPQVPVVVAPIPETPKVPVSLYAGMHPNMLYGRRRY
jgi:hypothetical protein